MSNLKLVVSNTDAELASQKLQSVVLSKESIELINQYPSSNINAMVNRALEMWNNRYGAAMRHTIGENKS